MGQHHPQSTSSDGLLLWQLAGACTSALSPCSLIDNSWNPGPRNLTELWGLAPGVAYRKPGAHKQPKSIKGDLLLQTLAEGEAQHLSKLTECTSQPVPEPTRLGWDCGVSCGKLLASIGAPRRLMDQKLRQKAGCPEQLTTADRREDLHPENLVAAKHYP